MVISSFFETEGIAILTMLVSRYRVELKDEPEFAHETFEQKKARLTECKQGLTMTCVFEPVSWRPCTDVAVT